MLSSAKQTVGKTNVLIAAAIYAVVNLLFVVKYGLRGGAGFACCAVAVFLLLLCLAFTQRVSEIKTRPYLIYFGIYSILTMILVPLFAAPGTFDVDRWDMIQLFWTHIFHGEYPYDSTGAITTVNIPAQSPIYFLLCLPFYLINAYQLIPLAGIWIWIYSVWKFPPANKSLAMMLVVISAAINYEIPTLSTIFFNSAIFFLWFLTLKKFEEFDAKQAVISGIIGGFLLATRNVFIVPILLLIVSTAKNIGLDRRLIFWCLSMFAAFLISFMPVMFIWGFDTWMAHNPFNVQSDAILPFWMMAALLIITVIAGLFCKRNWDILCLISGVVLFLSALLTLSIFIAQYGFQRGYLGSEFDVAYLIFCLPFIIYYISDESHSLLWYGIRK